MKRVLAMALILLYLLGLVGCKSSSLPEEMAEDFSFAIRWNTNGISSYDSLTGVLVKDAKAAEPKDYTAAYFLTDDEKQQIYAMIRELKPYDYPDLYEPKDQGVLTEKTDPLTLTVRMNDTEKTIRVQNTAGLHASKDQKAQKLLAALNAIEVLLESSEAWKALPDYEQFYE